MEDYAVIASFQVIATISAVAAMEKKAYSVRKECESFI